MRRRPTTPRPDRDSLTWLAEIFTHAQAFDKDGRFSPLRLATPGSSIMLSEESVLVEVVERVVERSSSSPETAD